MNKISNETYTMKIELYNFHKDESNLMFSAEYHNQVTTTGKDIEDDYEIKNIVIGDGAGKVYNLDKFSNLEEMIFEKIKDFTSTDGVIDGTVSFTFNDDAVALLDEMYQEDEPFEDIESRFYDLLLDAKVLDIEHNNPSNDIEM